MPTWGNTQLAATFSSVLALMGALAPAVAAEPPLKLAKVAGPFQPRNIGHRSNTGHLAQYAHPNLLSLIFYIEREWQAIDDRKFGIGNISVAGGLEYDNHKSHRKGVEMDIRPIRKDKLVGQAAQVSRFDAVYDRDATIKLVRLFVQHPMVTKVFFNDDKVQQAIGRVRSWRGHDDHIHLEIKESA